MLRNRGGRINPKLGIATSGFVAVVVILLIIAAAGYGLYFTGHPSTSTLTTTVSSATTVTTTQASSSNISQDAESQVTALAYSHWANIGTKNLIATMSQYAPNAELGWYVSPSSALNGTYTNSSSIDATWAKFFNANPTTYYTIYNYTMSVNGTFASARADIWYVLGNATITLKLPYELDYKYQSGAWVLTGDWWGLPNDPGTVVHGVVPAASTATTSSSTSSSTQTSSTETTTSGTSTTSSSNTTQTSST